jgi:hypothetical protein
MVLSKIGDQPDWRDIIDRISQGSARMQTPATETMTRLQLEQKTIRARKDEIETTLSQMSVTKNNSAWQAALEGGDSHQLESRYKLREEYQALEQKERFNESAIDEGRRAVDTMDGQVSLQICHDLKPDYVKAVAPKAQAAARQMLEAMEIERRFVEELLRHNIRIGHLGRISFPFGLSRDGLELFLRELSELA